MQRIFSKIDAVSVVDETQTFDTVALQRVLSSFVLDHSEATLWPIILNNILQQTEIWSDQHASCQGLSSKYFTFIPYLKDISLLSASRKLLMSWYWHCFQHSAAHYALIVI